MAKKITTVTSPLSPTAAAYSGPRWDPESNSLVSNNKLEFIEEEKSEITENFPINAEVNTTRKIHIPEFYALTPDTADISTVAYEDASGELEPVRALISEIKRYKDELMSDMTAGRVIVLTESQGKLFEFQDKFLQMQFKIRRFYVTKQTKIRPEEIVLSQLESLMTALKTFISKSISMNEKLVENRRRQTFEKLSKSKNNGGGMNSFYNLSRTKTLLEQRNRRQLKVVTIKDQNMANNKKAISKREMLKKGKLGQSQFSSFRETFRERRQVKSDSLHSNKYNTFFRNTDLYSTVAERRRQITDTVTDAHDLEIVRVPCKIATFGIRNHLIPATKIVVADPIDASSKLKNEHLVKNSFVLIRRGGDVTFREKILIAKSAKASGIVFVDQVTPGHLTTNHCVEITGSNDDADNMQIVSISYESGEAVIHQIQACDEVSYACGVIQYLQNARDDIPIPPPDINQ